MQEKKNWLVEELRSREIILEDGQVDQLLDFSVRVWEEATMLGLSGRNSLEEILQKDILDSLTLLPYIKEGLEGKVNARLLDIGSGAGFPGIPVKIALPHIFVFIVESKEKSVRFIRTQIQRMGLNGIEAMHARVEELAEKPGWRHGFDFVTGRAVAPIRRFLEWSASFLKPGGVMFLQKGKKLNQELEDAGPVMEEFGVALGGIRRGLEGEQKIAIMWKM